ncbi:MAG: hypothetical protein H7Y13_11925 [Sphingobacteriaceae bacterium]|nr:hypothetical protein [Sphingobacteriaceae bacterium]
MISNFPSRPIRNRGGYITFQFIPSIYIAQFPQINSHTISAAGIVLLAGTAWYQGYSTPETLLFSDEPEKTTHGTHFNLKVNAFTPGDKPELTSLLYEMEDLQFLVKLTDPRGKLKLIGSPTFPLQLKSVFNSGDQRSSSKGYNLQFTTQALHRALEIVA